MQETQHKYRPPQVIAGVSVANTQAAAWPALQAAVKNAAAAALLLPTTAVTVTDVVVTNGARWGRGRGRGRGRGGLLAVGSVVSYTVTAANKDPKALTTVTSPLISLVPS